MSKNGNLMLNFPLPNSGMLDDRELKVLSGITDWMTVNSEAIYATRPWKISGQTVPATPPSADASFNDIPPIPSRVRTFDGQMIETGSSLWRMRASSDGGDSITINWERLASAHGDGRSIS